MDNTGRLLPPIKEAVDLAGIEPPAIIGFWRHDNASSSYTLPAPWLIPLVCIWQVPTDPNEAKDYGDPKLAGTWAVEFQEGRCYFGPSGLPSRQAAIQLVDNVLKGKHTLATHEFVRRT